MYYWERDFGSSGPPGEALSAMRRSIGEEPGSQPAMWPLYSQLDPDGRLTEKLRAEHVALGLYGVHQQSQRSSMHKPGVPLGLALRALRASGRFSPEAVDSRVQRAVTASSLEELGTHLRSLISQLGTLKPAQVLDYTQLTRDLELWQRPGRRARMLRTWGAQYFPPPPKNNSNSHNAERNAS